MQAIRILRGCGASGQSLGAGIVYAVPAEVSEKDAAILVRMGKAEPAELARAKPAASADLCEKPAPPAAKIESVPRRKKAE